MTMVVIVNSAGKRSPDTYRVPHGPQAGCRLCGTVPRSPKIYYCSDPCRVEFERNHFWTSARAAALERAKVYRIPPKLTQRGEVAVTQRWDMLCARCGEEPYDPEVNHIVPLNGRREFFSCSHHLDNLEVLCHDCHLVVTREQRAAGLIR